MIAHMETSHAFGWSASSVMRAPTCHIEIPANVALAFQSQSVLLQLLWAVLFGPDELPLFVGRSFGSSCKQRQNQHGCPGVCGQLLEVLVQNWLVVDWLQRLRLLCAKMVQRSLSARKSWSSLTAANPGGTSLVKV